MKLFSRRNIVQRFIFALPVLTLMAGPLMAGESPIEPSPTTLTTDSGRKIQGILFMPQKLPAPTILLLHDWTGLNKQALTSAADYAKQGYIVLAADLYNGKVATNPKQAMAFVKSLDHKAASDAVSTWINWLKNHPYGTKKVAALGYSLGGGWALRGSIADPVDATVIYYGYVKEKAPRLAALQGPLLGHFAEKDKRVNHKMVEAFEAEMKKAGKTITSYWYPAGHSFYNDEDKRFDLAASKLSMIRTLAFLKKHLGD